jgi:hypothetical protein
MQQGCTPGTNEWLSPLVSFEPWDEDHAENAEIPWKLSFRTLHMRSPIWHGFREGKE